MNNTNSPPHERKKTLGSSSFREALTGEQEIRITVIRAKDGKRRTLPIWFTVEGDGLEMLPMYGLKTIWFRDIEKNGSMTITIKRETMEAAPKVIRDPKTVEGVKQRFSKKYGVEDVKRYYPTSEVSLEVSL